MAEISDALARGGWKYAAGVALAVVLFGGQGSLAVEPPQLSPRERISINDNWRFIKGDPPGDAPGLLYDVRPPATKPAGAAPQADPKAPGDPALSSNQPAATTPAVIKSWILPSGNDFIKDPSRKFIRPGGSPAEGVSYGQTGFDDTSWRQINLPHDWAIEGPFMTQGGGGIGRLRSSGVGWYRRSLDISASDAGKSIFLDVDGAMSYAADNGDPTSLELFQSHQRAAFNGLCLAIIRGRPGQPGKIQIKASAPGLKPGTAWIQTKAGGN